MIRCMTSYMYFNKIKEVYNPYDSFVHAFFDNSPDFCI